MYGIAIKPLILKLQTPRTVQKWYADDGNAAGTLQQLHELFENLSNQGPSFGYHVNATKCQLIVKPSTKQKAEIFLQTQMSKFSIVREFSDQLLAVTRICDLKHKTNDYTKLIQKFSNFGKSSPHAAYHCYVKGLQNKMTFLSRTTPKTTDFLRHAGEIISNKLIPALTNRDSPDGYSPSPSEKVGWQSINQMITVETIQTPRIFQHHSTTHRPIS